jgi:predicted TIM-barrel fold metal-dependent hydrolase
MRSGFRIVDAHTHVGQARHSGRSYSAGDLLRDMDRHGVEQSVVIPFPVVDDYRVQHDIIGQAVRVHSDRLIGTACLSPFLPLSDFQEEVKRCRELYGFRALKLQTQFHGLNPISTGSDFFFEAALTHDMAVICHTGAGLPFSAPSLYIMPARKFPSLRLVLGHAGGGIFVHEAIVAASVCPNITLELSTLMPHHVLEVLRYVSSNRLMIGSDLPENLSTELDKIIELGITEDQKREILCDTARRIFA